MLVGQWSCHAATWRSFDETLHNEEWFIDIFNGSGIFSDGRCYRTDPYRPTPELVNDSEQDLIINLVKPVSVDIERLKSYMCNLVGYRSVAFHLCKVAHTTQQRIGNTRRSATPPTDFYGGFIVNRHLQQHGRAAYDALQCLGIIVFQVHVNAETSTQRGCKHTAACRGSNECEGVQINLDRPCRRAFVNHYVDAIVLHGRVKILFNNRRKTVDFVYKEYIVGFK